jgi:hypothetical protein
MVKRKGLGKNLGKGYKNILNTDPAIHSMSARGVKQKKELIQINGEKPLSEWKDSRPIADFYKYKPNEIMPAEQRKQEYQEMMKKEHEAFIKKITVNKLMDWKREGEMENIKEFSSLPSKHVEEFKKDFDDDLKDLKERFKDGEITYEEFIENLNEQIGDYSMRVEEDMSQPEATIKFSNDEEAILGYYEDYDDTEFAGDFDTEWIKTDAWRGYYNIKANPKKWIELSDDNILAFSEDAENLKRFDEDVTAILEDINVKWARAIARSSNLFSSGYTLYAYVPDLVAVGVKNPKKIEILLKDIIELKSEFRDPVTYEMTALTGKDPSQFDREDYLFTKSAHRLMKGENLNKVMKDMKLKLKTLEKVSKKGKKK